MYRFSNDSAFEEAERAQAGAGVFPWTEAWKNLEKAVTQLPTSVKEDWVRIFLGLPSLFLPTLTFGAQWTDLE